MIGIFTKTSGGTFSEQNYYGGGGGVLTNQSSKVQMTGELPKGGRCCNFELIDALWNFVHSRKQQLRIKTHQE